VGGAWGSLVALGLSLGAAFVLQREKVANGSAALSPWWIFVLAFIVYYVLPDPAVYALPPLWAVTFVSRRHPRGVVA
jgi:hypothetical protein